MEIPIRPVETGDAEAWLQMRISLWPEDDEPAHRQEIERFFAGEFPRGPWQALVADAPTEGLLGFAEVSVRTYAQGCTSSRVAYLEGWFVAPHARRRGIGRALVVAAEAWGRQRACSEFASDADAENHTSHAAHRALGFDDVGLVRCFRKDLANE